MRFVAVLSIFLFQRIMEGLPVIRRLTIGVLTL